MKITSSHQDFSTDNTYKDFTKSNVKFDDGEIPIESIEGMDAFLENEKGKPDGIATLNSDSKVHSNQLPSYVDDIQEFDSFNEFPETGAKGKIYFDKELDRSYRWSGSQYLEITTEYHLELLEDVNNENKTTGKILEVLQDGDHHYVDKPQGTDLGIKIDQGVKITSSTGQGTVIPNSTESSEGLMTKEDKQKLNSIVIDELNNRSNHTGTQPISSVENLQSHLDNKISKSPSRAYTLVKYSDDKGSINASQITTDGKGNLYTGLIHATQVQIDATLSSGNITVHEDVDSKLSLMANLKASISMKAGAMEFELVTDNEKTTCHVDGKQIITITQSVVVFEEAISSTDFLEQDSVQLSTEQANQIVSNPVLEKSIPVKLSASLTKIQELEKRIQAMEKRLLMNRVK